MCIDFDGHHFGGSSFVLYMIFWFCHKTWTHQFLKKKKKKKTGKSPSIWSRTPNSVQIRQSGQTGNRGVT